MNGSPETQSPLLIVGIIAAFVVAFPIVWCSVLFVIGAMSGWGDLATRFATDDPAPPQTRDAVSGRLGWAHYRGVLTLGRDGDHIFVAVMPLFRFGHPPLRIPIEAIRESPASALFGKRVKLDLAGAADLVISDGVWRSLVGPADALRSAGPR